MWPPDAASVVGDVSEAGEPATKMASITLTVTRRHAECVSKWATHLVPVRCPDGAQPADEKYQTTDWDVVRWPLADRALT